MICKMPGCGRHSHGHGHLCSRHAKHHRRHGDPRQYPVRKAELAKHIRHITRWIDSRANAARLYKTIEDVMAKVEEDAAARERAYAAGHFMPRWQLDAYREIAKVMATVPRRKAALTVMAIGYLGEQDAGHRFVSDNATWAQAARMFRTLSEVSIAKYPSPRTGKTHRVYRDTSPRTLRLLGQTLLAALGPFGMAIHEREQAVARDAAEIRQGAFEAFSAATPVNNPMEKE